MTIHLCLQWRRYENTKFLRKFCCCRYFISISFSSPWRQVVKPCICFKHSLHVFDHWLDSYQNKGALKYWRVLYSRLSTLCQSLGLVWFTCTGCTGSGSVALRHLINEQCHILSSLCHSFSSQCSMHADKVQGSRYKLHCIVSFAMASSALASWRTQRVLHWHRQHCSCTSV